MMNDRSVLGAIPAVAAADRGTGPEHNADDVREANKRTVLAFYDTALNQQNIDEAAAYLRPDFINHNPRAKDGVDGFRALMHDLKNQGLRVQADVKRAFADGNFVILHVHVKFQPEDPGLAIVEIFRVQDEKIVEHWDVRQAMPETSANTNGMF